MEGFVKIKNLAQRRKGAKKARKTNNHSNPLRLCAFARTSRFSLLCFELNSYPASLYFARETLGAIIACFPTA
jgi:hypothetical protein